MYIDTSVLGGCFEPEFLTASLALIEQFRSGTLIAVISNLAVLELDRAPVSVRAVLVRIPAAHRENVLVTPEAARLARCYIAAGVIGWSMLEDAEHIATATVHEVDAIVSWNFKHIVNTQRIQGYHSVNVREGWPPIAIRSPAEVIANGG